MSRWRSWQLPRAIRTHTARPMPSMSQWASWQLSRVIKTLPAIPILFMSQWRFWQLSRAIGTHKARPLLFMSQRRFWQLPRVIKTHKARPLLFMSQWRFWQLPRVIKTHTARPLMFMSQWRFWQLPRVIKHIHPDLYCSCPSEDFGKTAEGDKNASSHTSTIYAAVKILATAEAVIKTYTTRPLLESCPSEAVCKWAVLKGLTHREVVFGICLFMICFIICVLTDSVALTWIYCYVCEASWNVCLFMTEFDRSEMSLCGW